MSTVAAGSHIPILVKLLEANKTRNHGPILELGIGYNSTPLLHWMCQTHRIPLFSYETDNEWLERFVEFSDTNHSLLPVKDWKDIQLNSSFWGIVLVDSRPAKERAHLATRVKDNADFVVLHDSEPEIDRFYRYGRAYRGFKYRYDFKKVMPNTTVLSNSFDLSFLDSI